MFAIGDQIHLAITVEGKLYVIAQTLADKMEKESLYSTATVDDVDPKTRMIWFTFDASRRKSTATVRA